VDDVSEELQDLVFLGLDHGFDGVRDGALIPFVIVEGPEGRGIQRFVEGPPDQVDLEGSVQRAVDFVRERMTQTPDARMVLVYDAYLRMDDDRFDAIHVEAVDGGVVRAVVAQPYRPTSPGDEVEMIGNAALLPREMGRLSEPD
jgi:hypothetical protein